MEGGETRPVRRVRILNRFKQLLRPNGDINEKRIRRRMGLVNFLTRRLTTIKVALFLVGYLWMLLLPVEQLGKLITRTDENALQPAQVNTNWNWGDVHTADRYLERLEQVRDSNFTSEQRAQWLKEEFAKLGIASSTQQYSFSTSISNVNGSNAYAVISSPRHSGNEAMVISASWLSRTGDGDGTLNMRGVSTVLALAGFLKRSSYWAKDIVLVISDGYLDGMQAWLSAYHGSSQPGLQAEPLNLTSGVIWTALNIDYPGHSFSHLGVFFEGLNGRLPNHDLMVSLDMISRWTAGIPTVLYDHLDPREEQSVDNAPRWLPKAIYNIPQVKSYLYQARNIARHVGYQYNGRGSGVHGLFHQFRIDAITLFCVPASGPHGFHAIGRTVESTLRTMNNMLERLHASFFFYILTGVRRASLQNEKQGVHWVLQIGFFLPSAILISAAMMFHGLSTWVDAAWILDVSGDGAIQKDKEMVLERTRWIQRRRPVISVLSIMAITHIVGAALFYVVSSHRFVQSHKALAPIVFTVFSAVPLVALLIPSTTSTKVAPMTSVLKALNLCFASTVISIITVLNFSLAASLTVVLGLPLVASSSSPSIVLRLLKYSGYAVLGLGWMLFAQQQMVDSIWNWQVLSVWFAPFICIVCVPLVVQAGIACLLPP